MLMLYGGSLPGRHLDIRLSVVSDCSDSGGADNKDLALLENGRANVMPKDHYDGFSCLLEVRSTKIGRAIQEKHLV